MDMWTCPRKCVPNVTSYSLIEVTMVVAIIGVLATLAIPRYDGAVDRQRADAAARRLVADLRYARDHARHISGSQDIQFPVASNTYVLTGVADPDRVSQIYTVNLSREPYFVDTISADVIDGDTLTFNGYGLPDSGAVFTIAVGAEFRCVAVDQTTGQISMTESMMALQGAGFSVTGP